MTYQNILIEEIWKDFDNITLENRQKKQQKENINEKIQFKCDCDEEYAEEYVQDIIEINDSILCRNCGVIFEDRLISNKAEWRTFNDENGFNDTGNRCGQEADPLAPVNSMSGMIYGNSKLSKINMWLCLPYEERVMYQLKNKINSIIATHRLPKCITTETLTLYKKFTNTSSKNKELMNLYRGKNKNGLLAVCFYYSSKYSNLHLSSSYISDIFDIDKKVFSKCCKIYNEIINNKCDNKIYDITDLVDRYTIKLNLSFNIQKLCKNIITSCLKINLFTGVSPQGVISGVIYFVNKEMSLNLDKENISSICDISNNTMVKIYKTILPNKVQIFNLIKQQK